MPNRYGVKERDEVVAHILELLLTGRLRAAIRASRSFMPGGFWSGYEAAREMLLPFAAEEHPAIRNGSAEHTRRACAERVALMADILVEDLRRRGVFDNSSRGKTVTAAATPLRCQ